MWIAKKEKDSLQYIQLEWESKINFDTIQISFDTITRTYIEMPFECSKQVSEKCVKDYDIQIWQNDNWITIQEIRDNFNRFRRYTNKIFSTKKYEY